MKLTEIILIAAVRLLTGAVAHSYGFEFEPVKQRIYFANHSSHLDTLLIWSLLPLAERRRVRPAAARDYWWNKPWRRWLATEIFRAIPVSRHNNTPGYDTLQDLEAALANGDSLIFFPEGTRTDSPDIQPFRSGLYRLLAKHPTIELVPVYIDNLGRVLPKGELLPVPIFCNVSFGKQFLLNDGETKDEFIARAQTLLEDLRAK